MKQRHRQPLLTLAAAALLALAPVSGSFAQTAAAPASPHPYFVHSKTAGGHAFASGGVSLEDRLAMHAEQRRYSLWVATVAKPSGAYLAEAKLKIVDATDRRTVLERTLEGPWLMVSLPPGRYEVTGVFRAEGSGTDQKLSETVSVFPGQVRQVVMRFDSNAEVSPEMRSPFDGNPFGATPID